MCKKYVFLHKINGLNLSFIAKLMFKKYNFIKIKMHFLIKKKIRQTKIIKIIILIINSLPIAMY